MDGVFIGSEALAAGVLTRGQLRWRYRAVLPDVYTPRDATLSLTRRAEGAWLWSRRRAVIAGQAAAAMHGASWVDDNAAVELIWQRRAPCGVVVRNERIECDEIVDIDGLHVTTPERTAFDLARHEPRDTAVRRLDALARATGIELTDIRPLLERYRGSRNFWQASAALSSMDGGARSPRETTVRLALVDAGFPSPRTDFGIAMGYDEPMVGIDFGRGDPRPFEATGWLVIPADDRLPGALVYLVRAAVIERGFPLWRLQRRSSA